VIALLLALSLAAIPPQIPEGRARYRVEIAGAPIGISELAVSCSGDGCAVRWRSRLRLPAAAGGGLRARRIDARLDRAGGIRSAEVEVDGVRRSLPGDPTVVPLSVAELLLGARQGGCIPVVDEETGRRGRACGELEGGRLRVEALGVVEQVVLDDDGFPAEVEIASQGTRFVREAGAELPLAPPPLEVRVPGPPGDGVPRRFCGHPVDPPPPPVDPWAFPPPRPDGSSCREQASAYAAAVRRRGIPARIALGVAHDGRGFVWHAWVEARTAAGWVPIDPAFGQVPAEGPRFTIARHGGAPASEAQAGRRILGCWGRASVE